PPAARSHRTRARDEYWKNAPPPLLRLSRLVSPWNSTPTPNLPPVSPTVKSGEAAAVHRTYASSTSSGTPTSGRLIVPPAPLRDWSTSPCSGTPSALPQPG